MIFYWFPYVLNCLFTKKKRNESVKERIKMYMSSSSIIMRYCINRVLFINMELSTCRLNIKVSPRNGGELIWNEDLLYYLHLLGPNSMPCFWRSMYLGPWEVARRMSLWPWSKVVCLWLLMRTSFMIYQDIIHNWLLLKRRGSTYLLEVWTLSCKFCQSRWLLQGIVSMRWQIMLKKWRGWG